MHDRHHRALALCLLALIPLQRLALALAWPDLLHDLDAGELKHMDLALFGLPGGESLIDRLRAWLSGPENIHHGGYPVVSLLFLAASRVLEPSLFLLRLLPIAATSLAALFMAQLVHRRVGPRAAWVALALFVGAPPLFLKWTTTSRGGHLEGIVFPLLMALLLDRALRGGVWRWLGAGLLGGFAVYFTYLAVPAVLLLSLGALIERAGCDRRAAARAAGALLLGGVVGFSPWWLGLLVLDLPYFDASIHQTSNPAEAAQVHARTLWDALAAMRQGLAHNLWPWAVNHSPEAAYASSTPDLLVYTPTATTWALRGAVAAAVLAGLVASVRQRSPFLVALCLLPAAHHLFVLRTANTVGYPDVPHRYFVLVFPAICAAAALGSDLPRVGRAVAAIAVIVCGVGLWSQSAWWGAPQWGQFDGWDAAALRQAGLGQVRADEGAQVADLLEATGPTANEQQRGVAMIYPAMADYYLLFRERPNERPYPSHLFREPDPLSQDDAQRRAVVQGALDATRARAGRDPEQLQRWLCSWEPSVEYAVIVAEARAEAGVACAD